MRSNSSQTSVHPLYEGTFSVGLDKKFNRIERQDSPEKGALKISLNPFLIKRPRGNYLFDVGIGDFGEDTSTEMIKENIAANDLSEYEISDIFCSHLHIDHIGGLAGRSSGFWNLTFPDAKLWVSGDAWKEVIGREIYYDDEKTEFLHFLNAKADLHFIEEEDQPYPEIKVRRIGGHTEFSQALFLDDGQIRFLMAGDVLAVRGEVNRKFAAKYDFAPKRSMEIRKKLLQKAYEENYILMAYHDSVHPLFTLSGHDEKKGYTIKNLSEDQFS